MELEDFGRITRIAFEYSLAIPVLIGLFKYIKGQLGNNLRILLILLILFIPMEFIAIYSSGLGNNLFYLSVIRAIAFVFYMIVFLKSINERNSKKLIIALAILYISVLLLEIMFSPRNYYLQFANAFYSLSLIIAPLIYLLELVDGASEVNIKKQPMFWISAGLLINSSILLILLYINNYLIEKDMTDELWISYIIKQVFGITLYIFLAVGFWKVNVNNTIKWPEKT